MLVWCTEQQAPEPLIQSTSHGAVPHTNESGTPMKVSVIGAGAIGGNIARRLSEAGHDVLIANARGPESVSAEVTTAGARPVELEAVTQDRDVIILAIPFGVQPKLKDLVATVPKNTVVVDTSNYYPGMNGQIEAVIDGQVESLWSQEQLGRPVVKA